ncbi:HlyD family efflux transporter periplasmic adaptor subunit [Pikeienuella piscinae]|uniref:HlyD family efflux transporter periplasmic adaptor subunit n=1 Tax=Pikeienuella piscinae TaxID=2748098 RepID=A0A7L5BXA0_9RHOB|nr:HlyD family efflux transporter periplasmic adaptor subunit [Pikeienuella piscinae]QIE54219.1 HlyD family efflux transporter periplasmic adaptor subunit [Pikeienuella piscinae]
MSMRRWMLAGALVAVIGGGAWCWLDSRSNPLPDGIVSSNGRTEAQRIDVASKFAGRLQEILVAEGGLAEAGQIIARMDSKEIAAQIREAKAGVRQAEHALIEAKALLAQRRSELRFAEQELARTETLNARGYETTEKLDLRRSEVATANAAVASAEAGIARAQASIEANEATVDRLRADLVEYELKAPRSGRVQYRLAEPGEVLAAGGLVVTLLDLTDVYMTVYLPTSAAGRLRYGAEARLIFDAAPEYVVPASVSFVASEAQFTPKYVETESEREKLLFRVKVKIPEDVLRDYQEIIKTGVPGMAYVRVDPMVDWPVELAVRLPDAD